MKSIGFIGAGRITKIFLQVIKNNKSEYKAIVVFDTDRIVVSNLKQQFPAISVAESPGEAALQDIVFLALHPPVIMETLDKIKDQVNSGTMLVSLAPKISLAMIKAALPHVPNLARLIPNATSIINEGYNPVMFAPSFNETKKQLLLRLLRRMGHTFEVPESKLESYAVLSAMLPTYFWFQWKQLIEIGNQFGLSVDEGKNTVRDTLLAAIRTYFYSGLSPEEVMDLIPVKPIGKFEEQINTIYRETLIPLFEKLKPMP